MKSWGNPSLHKQSKIDQKARLLLILVMIFLLALLYKLGLGVCSLGVTFIGLTVWDLRFTGLESIGVWEAVQGFMLKP